jgi:hypothetical protein
MAYVKEGALMGTKGALKNKFTFWTPINPGRLRCGNSEYPDIPAFSRLAVRAPRLLKLRTYFFVTSNLIEYFCFGILGLYAISAGMVQ